MSCLTRQWPRSIRYREPLVSKPVKTFKAGTIHNACRLTGVPTQIAPSVTIHYPARLEAMALDPAKIATNDSLIYTAGQIDFCVALFKHVTAQYDATAPQDIVISARTGRRTLVLHAARLMQQALHLGGQLSIDVIDDAAMRHCGLGSSSGTIASVASAVNELFGCPVAPHDLVHYCAQNHGEEIDGEDEELTAVQCIGGSAVCGNYEGGAIIITGEATPIATSDIDEPYRVIIGVPRDFSHPDSLELMRKEEDNMEGFVSTGTTHGPHIAYRLVHEVMPELQLGSYAAMKQLIFDYRWDMGSIRNCSFVLPRINDIAEALRPMRDDPEILIVSLSSVGPGFFAITSNPDKVRALFQEQNMQVLETTIYNPTYGVEKGIHG